MLLAQKVAGESPTILATSDGGSLVVYNQFSRKMEQGSKSSISVIIIILYSDTIETCSIAQKETYIN